MPKYKVKVLIGFVDREIGVRRPSSDSIEINTTKKKLDQLVDAGWLEQVKKTRATKKSSGDEST